MTETDPPKGHVTLRLPAAVAIAIVSALASAFGTHLLTPGSADAAALADVRGDIKALQTDIRALRDAQNQMLDRINREGDAASNAALIAQLRAALAKGIVP